MKVLVLHGTDRRDSEFASQLQQALGKHNHQADCIPVNQSSSTPVSTAPYQLVCVMSSFSGWWKPKFAPEVDGILKRCTRLQGKKGAAFVPAKLGHAKALKILMGMMESQGVMVEDFASVKSSNDAEEIAARLNNLIRPQL